MMDRRVAERCVQLMAASQHALSAVDLTGGAPELTPQFRSGTLCLLVWPEAAAPAQRAGGAARRGVRWREVRPPSLPAVSPTPA